MRLVTFRADDGAARLGAVVDDRVIDLAAATGGAVPSEMVAFIEAGPGALARARQFFEQMSLTREQTRLAEDDLRLSRIRYEGGEGSALDVVTAQSQLIQARSNHYTALANYLNARADLEVASGR